MAHKTQTYAQVRSKMQPGDIVAFGGKGAFSDIIKFATASAVSHVGVIYESKALIDGGTQAGHIVDVMESTTLNYKGGKAISGVQRNRLSDHVDYYEAIRVDPGLSSKTTEITNASRSDRSAPISRRRPGAPPRQRANASRFRSILCAAPALGVVRAASVESVRTSSTTVRRGSSAKRSTPRRRRPRRSSSASSRLSA